MLIYNKLGEGSFANVFLARTENNKFIALKVAKTNISKKTIDKYTLDEVKILKQFKNSPFLINLVFHKITPDTNEIGFELLGNELYQLIKKYKTNEKRLSMPVIKHLTTQILYGLVELAEKDILHNDLKPENILFTNKLKILTESKYKTIINVIKYCRIEASPKYLVKYYTIMNELELLNSRVKIVDFGNAFTKDLAAKNKDQFNHARPTRHYVSPEILLKAPYWIESDMWSFGCIIFELLTNQVLFKPNRENDMGVNSMHLAAIIQTFGNFTKDNLSNGKKRKRYFISNKHKFNYLINGEESLFYLLHNIHNYSEKDASEISQFLLPIFNYDPKKRITPINCLNSPWLN